MSNPRLNSTLFATLALLASIGVLVGASAPATTPGVPSLQVLRALVEGYAHAIETNNRALALWYVHPDSPRRSEIDAMLRDQLGAYFERARTSHLEHLVSSDGTISARVDQEIIRVFGLKFARAERRSIYSFRALDESWRIWGIEELAAHAPRT